MQKVVDFGKIASLSDDDSKKKWAWQQEKTSTTAGKARNKGKGKVGGEEKIKMDMEARRAGQFILLRNSRKYIGS